MPEFNEDRTEFTLLVKAVRKSIEPEHEMPVLSQAEVRELVEEAEARFVEQEAPG